MKRSSGRLRRPDRISEYFRLEWASLLAVTVTGIIYNVGLIAGPWFEGQLAETLLEVLKGESDFDGMLHLVLCYVGVIAAVQIIRCLKRFYVRHFANNVNRRMKKVIYAVLVGKSAAELKGEDAGSLLTRAVSDVDDCAEGMRKFTTEIFDTGIALTCYVGMLLYYDWRLGLICLIWAPLSYIIAENMKRPVQKAGAAFKIRAGELNGATLDRAENAITYRVFGREEERHKSYGEKLDAYERSAVKAQVLISALPPVYNVLSMTGVIFIIWLGGRNVMGSGWTEWTIASFTTFVSCFAKLSLKSSKAAKLFNSVQRARVSWTRIKPFLIPEETVGEPETAEPELMQVKDLSFAYPGGGQIFRNISFDLKPGQILGVTGPVACGKSTLGRAFLCEHPYGGSIKYGNAELSGLEAGRLKGIVGYLGHDTELLNDTIGNNILLGDEGSCMDMLRLVCFDREVSEMEKGENTRVGNGGVRLSGGQAARLALARTLAHRRPLYILDDPFAALDTATEKAVFENLRKYAADSAIILISHRLYLFPELDGVLWLENGQGLVGRHEELMEKVPEYAGLYNIQTGGGRDED